MADIELPAYNLLDELLKDEDESPFSRAYTTEFDFYRIYNLPNPAQEGESDEQLRAKVAAIDAHYEAKLDFYKLHATARPWKSLTVGYVAEPIEIGAALKGIVLELVRQSRTLERISFGDRLCFRSHDIIPTASSIDFEIEVLDAICQNNNVTIQSLTTQSLLPFSSGLPLHELFSNLTAFEFVVGSRHFYPVEACLAFERAFMAGENLKELYLAANSWRRSLDGGSQHLVETLQRCIQMKTSLQKLSCNLAVYPALWPTIRERMSSLETVNITNVRHDGNTAIDVTQNLPRKSLTVGEGAFSVTGIISETSSSTIEIMIFRVGVPESTLLSFANLKHLYALSLVGVSGGRSCDAIVEQVLLTSDSLGFCRGYGCMGPTVLALLRCNEAFFRYREAEANIPKAAIPRLLCTLQKKPRLMYSVLRQEIEMLEKRNEREYVSPSSREDALAERTDS